MKALLRPIKLNKRRKRELFIYGDLGVAVVVLGILSYGLEATIAELSGTGIRLTVLVAIVFLINLALRKKP